MSVAFHYFDIDIISDNTGKITIYPRIRAIYSNPFPLSARRDFRYTISILASGTHLLRLLIICITIINMIKSIEFINFRNLSGKYQLKTRINLFVGKNSSGKTNLLDGIRLAFSTITGDYYRISKTDFKNSDDATPIIIKVELDDSAIPSLDFLDTTGATRCGFMVIVKKGRSGRFSRELRLLNGNKVNFEIVVEDPAIPKVQTIPLIRAEDIYTDSLATSLTDFIESEDAYQRVKDESKAKLKEEIAPKVNEFKSLCQKFKQDLDIEMSDPRLSNERLFLVDGGSEEHRSKIGSDYKSIANVMLNLIGEGQGIILIDEIENHLHPALLRMLLRELRKHESITVIATTHSPVVVNDANIEELIDVSSIRMDELDEKIQRKLNLFLHPGRGELIFGDNIVLVEGYTEELILKNYAVEHELNWTIVNVAGVMFQPYIELGHLLGKKMVVMSDDDRIKSTDGISTSRFKNLKELCEAKLIKLIDIENTLETDLYKNGFLDCAMDYLEPVENHPDYFVAKNKQKAIIAELLIEEAVCLSRWHAIQDIENEFRSN